MKLITAMLLGIYVFLAGCSSRPVAERPVPVLAQGPSSSQATVSPSVNNRPEQVSPKPVQRMLQAAGAHINAGELRDAESLLSKAQRMAPQEPGLYYYLAQLRLKQERFSEALNLTTRGLSLTNKNGTYYARILSLKNKIQESQ